MSNTSSVISNAFFGASTSPVLPPPAIDPVEKPKATRTRKAKVAVVPTPADEPVLDQGDGHDGHPSGVTFMDEFKVLVRPDPVLERTLGGIIIPETAKKKFEVSTGTVEMVADDAFTYHVKNGARHPKPGDRVLLARYAGVELSSKYTLDGVDYRIVNDRDILAVISF